MGGPFSSKGKEMPNDFRFYTSRDFDDILSGCYVTSEDLFALMDHLRGRLDDSSSTPVEEDESLPVCERCGHHMADLVAVTTEEGVTQMWCRTCRSFHAVECAHCGKLISFDCATTVIDANGREVDWCPECASNAIECDRCGRLCESTQEVITDGDNHLRTEDWCMSCVNGHASRCCECGELIANDELRSFRMWNTGETVMVCDSCREDSYYVCERCGALVHEDDAVVDDMGRAYCPDCHERIDDEFIEGYHHTRPTWFIQDDGRLVDAYDASDDERRRLYLGLELEVDNLSSPGTLARYVKETYPRRFECKHDGSLSSRGFEIVTQPCTPAWALDGAIEDIADKAREMSGRSDQTDTCGFHIHINRKFFRDGDAVYRLDRLFHRFSTQMIKFSRRFQSQMRWCEICGDGNLAEIDDVKDRKRVYWDRKLDASRYEAVNNTNDRTVEIRLWRGSLNTETIRATIEFTTGLAVVCNTMGDELAEKLTWTQLKLLVRYALESIGLPHDDFDSYIVRREL